VSRFAACPFDGPSMANGRYILFWKLDQWGSALHVMVLESQNRWYQIFITQGFQAFRRSKGFKTYVYNSPTTDISLVYPQGIEGSRVNIPETYRVSRA